MQDLVPLLTLVGFALLLWLLLVRPQARRRRELEHMQSTLEVGEDVVLTSGVFGTVRAMDEGTIDLEIAAGVTIKVARAAVGHLVPDVDPEPADDDTPGPDGTARPTEEN